MLILALANKGKHSYLPLIGRNAVYRVCNF